MKANRFLEKLTSDLPAKIFCLVIAMFLYLFYQLSLVDKKNIVIPLRVVQDGAVVCVSDVPSSVRVTVRSNSAKSNLITSDVIRATLNLDSLTDNDTYDVPVFIDIDDEILKIDPLEVSVKPEYVSVRVEKKIKKAVRLETPTIGEVAHGYTVSKINVKPSAVYVTGAESIVDATTSILTSTVDIENLSSTSKHKVQIHKTNKMLDYDDERNYETEIVIEPVEMERSFIGVPIVCVNLSDGFQIQGELSPVDFTLAGRMTVIENFKLSDNTVTVDCSEITEEGEYTLPVRIRTTNYLSVVEKSLENVTVNVIKKEIDEESEENPNQ